MPLRLPLLNALLALSLATLAGNASAATPFKMRVPLGGDLGGGGAAGGGGPAALVASPSPLDLLANTVGGPAKTAQLTITNSGATPVTITGNVQLGGADASEFQITQSTCASGSALPAGGNCVVTLGFTPSATGSKAASVSLASDAGLVSVPVTGVGSAYFTATAIRAGGYQSFGFKSDGSLWATGKNQYGVLATGDTTNRTSFFQMLPPGVSEVAGAPYGDRLFILKPDKTLWAIGFGGSGRLGTGSSSDVSVLTQVLDNVVSIKTGAFHTFALKADGSLWGAGAANYNQMGTGTSLDRWSFTFVMNDVASMVGGWGHSLVLKTDGSLWTIGYNQNGQVGRGDAGFTQYSFLHVMDGVAEVAATYQESIALKADGTLWATGKNGNGVLGLGDSTRRVTFTEILGGVKAVAAGGESIYALKLDGTLWAAGRNSEYQLGAGDATLRNVFTQVMSGVSAVAAGSSHAIVLDSTGVVWGTGYNYNGELGMASPNLVNGFTPIPAPAP